MRLRGPHPWEGAFWSDARLGFRYGWSWGWMVGVTLGGAMVLAAFAFARSICR